MEKIVYNINITERASESVNDALQEHEHLRLSAKPGGCSGWKWDLQTEDDLGKTSMDEVFKTDYGFNIVISKRDLNDIIGSAKIDYTNENLVEQGFVIQRLSSLHACGCGESFIPIKDM